MENRRAKNILSRISAPGDICNYNLNVNLRWIFNEVQKKIFEKIEKYHGCGISDNCYFIFDEAHSGKDSRKYHEISYINVLLFKLANK